MSALGLAFFLAPPFLAAAFGAAAGADAAGKKQYLLIIVIELQY
jgi:hypothetical protein